MTTDLVERLCDNGLSLTYREMDDLRFEAAAEIQRMRAELDQVREILGDREVEIERLRAERRVIPGTNIPDVGTPSY